MWFEPLPDECPPTSAIPPDGIFYRLAVSTPPSCTDFWSHRKLYPTAHYNTTECIAMAVSVYTNTDALAAIQKMKAHKTKVIVGVKLGPEAGKIKQTGAEKTHFSWWRAEVFPVLDHIV